MAHPRSTWLAISLLALASLGSACGRDRSHPHPPTTPPGSPTTPGRTATPAPPASAASK